MEQQTAEFFRQLTFILLMISFGSIMGKSENRVSSISNHSQSYMYDPL